MQVISVIGHVAGKLEEVESAGRRFLRFRVKADGNAMEPAKKTAEELNMEHFVNRIQLQDI